jgi:hypothetical protein
MHRTAAQRTGADGGGAPAEPGTLRGYRVLVVGTDDWAVEQAAGVLENAEATVLRCHEPGEPAFPCNAFIEGRQCPLDVGFEVVLTARARPVASLQAGETGVVCALRGKRPLVVAGIARNHPFRDLATAIVPEDGELVSAVAKALEDVIIELG